MKCDKCGQKFTESWIPYKNCPRYKITENTAFGEYSPIYLCADCSKKFAEWLDGKDVQN